MLKKTFKSIDRIFLFIEEWSLFSAVGIALLTGMAKIVERKFPLPFDLLNKYLFVYLDFSLSFYWSDEVVRKVIFFTTFIGCVAAVRSRSLIRIDALPQIFPVLKKPLTLFSHLMVLIFSSTMVYLGWQMTVMMFEDEYAKTATLQIPEWYFYTVLPLMGVMMFIRTLIVMVEDWRGKQDITGEK